MVESVRNTDLSALLRTQNIGTSGQIASLKSNKQASEALTAAQDTTSQTQKTGASMQNLALNANGSANSNLPRGSLVDMLV